MAVSAPPAPGRAERFPLWPTALTAVLVVAAGFAAALLIGIPVVALLGTAKNPGDPGTNAIEAAFYLGAAALLIPRLTHLARASLRDLGIRPLEPHDWLYAAGGSVTIFALQFLYQFVLSATHQQNHVQAGFEHFTVGSTAAAVLVLITGAAIAPVCEELFFRGFLFNALAERIPVLWSALITGLLFGAAHGDWVLFPVLSAFGLIQALIYRKTGNLVVPMIVHALNNGVFLTLMILIPGFH